MTTPDPTANPEPAVAPEVDVLLTDYADLGTAFGLDASVARGASEPLLPGSVGDTAPSVVPPWEHRLIRRNGL